MICGDGASVRSSSNVRAVPGLRRLSRPAHESHGWQPYPHGDDLGPRNARSKWLSERSVLPLGCEQPRSVADFERAARTRVVGSSAPRAPGRSRSSRSDAVEQEVGGAQERSSGIQTRPGPEAPQFRGPHALGRAHRAQEGAAQVGPASGTAVGEPRHKDRRSDISPRVVPWRRSCNPAAHPNLARAATVCGVNRLTAKTPARRDLAIMAPRRRPDPEPVILRMLG